MKILLLGDLHGNAAWTCRALTMRNAEYDVAIALGDFGFYWYRQDNTAPLVETIAVTGKPMWFIDGNHEDFSMLPPRDSTDKVEVAPNLFYLPRGYRWELGGRTFLSLGGAVSVDQSHRKVGVTWFYDEEISDADVQRCLDKGPVDVLLCHEAPNSPVMTDRLSQSKFLEFFPNGAEMGRASAKSRAQIDRVLSGCQPKLTVHGHYHWHYTCEAAPGQRVVGLSLEGAPGSAAILDTNTLNLEIV